MPVKERSLRVVENNDPIYTITVTKDNKVFDLNGSTLTFMVKTSASIADEDAEFTYTNGDGITITEPDDGIAELVFSRADISTPGTFWYTLTITFTDTRQEIVAYGPFIIIDV